MKYLVSWYSPHHRKHAYFKISTKKKAKELATNIRHRGASTSIMIWKLLDK